MKNSRGSLSSRLYDMATRKHFGAGRIYSWRQEQIAASAQSISDMGKQLYDRIRTLLDHYKSIGDSLERAVISYNRATASLESRILPSARKFKEYGAATGEELTEISAIDSMPRALEAREGSQATSSAESGRRRGNRVVYLRAPRSKIARYGE